MRSRGISEVVGALIVVMILIISMIVLLNLINAISGEYERGRADVERLVRELEMSVVLREVGPLRSNSCTLLASLGSITWLRGAVCAIRSECYDVHKACSISISANNVTVRLDDVRADELRGSVLRVKLVTGEGVARPLAISFTRPYVNVIPVPPMNVTRASDRNEVTLLISVVNNSTGLMYVRVTNVSLAGRYVVCTSSASSKPAVIDEGRSAEYVVNVTCTPTSPGYHWVNATVKLSLGCNVSYTYVFQGLVRLIATR